VERDRLMTQAGVFRAKGQITDARETLEKALAMAQGGKPRDIAMVHEQIGDLLLVEEELEAATEAFQQAFHIDPTRTTAEKKIASTQMAISDREAEKRLGQKALQDDSIASIIASGDLTGHGGKRNAGIAMGLSVAVPGFGQIYNGQLVKGLILIAVFAIALLVISFSPEKDDLFKLIGSTFALKPARDVSVSPPIMAVAVIGFIAWIYAIVDAPFFTRQNEVSREERSPSAVDKSGWEV
jgi:tetratricopeptide (TPR) repeat protein